MHAEARTGLAVGVALVRAEPQPGGLGEGLGQLQGQPEAGEVEGLRAVLGPVQAGGLELDADVPAAVDDVGGAHLQERGTTGFALGFGRRLGLVVAAAAGGGGGVAGDGGVDLFFNTYVCEWILILRFKSVRLYRPWTVGGSAFLCTHLPGSPRAAGRGPRP